MSAYTSGTAIVTLSAAAAGGGGGSAVDLSGSMLTVGAQPASDPHFVKCSDGSAAAPCQVTGTGSAGTAATGVVTVQGIASMTALKVDGSAVTQPVSAASLPLPTGAATAAKQPALGTAGSSSTDVISVQGIASGTALPISAASLPLPSGAATSANQSTEITALQLIDDPVGSSTGGTAGTKSMLGGGIYNSSAPTLTNGQQAALQLDANGYLAVNIKAGAGSGGTALADGATFTASTTSATPASGFYHATIDTCADGKACAMGITSKRALMVSGFDTGGTATTDSTAHAQKSLLVDTSGTALTQDTQLTHDGNIATPASVTGGALMGRARSSAITALTQDDASLLNTSLYGDLRVTAVDSSGAFLAADTQATHDGALTVGSTTGGVSMWQAKDTTPCTAVSADGDAVIPCATRAGMLWSRTYDPCTGNAKTTTPISSTADVAIITATSGKKNYICSLSLVASAAEVVSVWEGTGTACGTGSAALAGSTTEANGLSFAANGGIALVGGQGTALNGITANVDTCLRISGSNRVSGFVTWVQQ
jgi:hypothetical protein